MKTILFVQGLGMTKHEWNNSFDEIALQLKAVGFRTIQFDLPLFKNGKTVEMPIGKRAQYIQKIAAKWKPVGLLAQSYGAPSSLLANLPTVRSQVFISGAFAPYKNLFARFKGELALQRSSGITYVPKEFWDDIKSFDDVKIAKTIKIPTCILHGDQDSKIPITDAQIVFNALSSTKKKLKIFKGGDHGIVDVPRSMREEFLQDIVAWFKETL